MLLFNKVKEYPFCSFICVNNIAHALTGLVYATQGGWILDTSLCVLAWVYTWDCLLIKDIKRLWPIHRVKTSNMQYAFGVQVYREVLCLECRVLNWWDCTMHMLSPDWCMLQCIVLFKTVELKVMVWIPSIGVKDSIKSRGLERYLL